jgi:sodium-dependent dicarboxylate transporter 2/3/5
VLPWREGVKIDWGIILLFGGGLSLGKQMFETGLAEVLARGFVGLTGVSTQWSLVAMLVVFTIFFTEICSNTATANMLAPIAIAMAREIGVSPIPAVLGVGLAATCGFMMPIGTGPNALVYGSGRASMREMIRAGWWLDLACAAILIGALYVVCTLAGWA